MNYLYYRTVRQKSSVDFLVQPSDEFSDLELSPISRHLGEGKGLPDKDESYFDFL
jgi:hypothetical protein